MKKEDTQSRRKFLKKAAYSVPVIAGLGMMTAPVDADAMSQRPGNHGGGGCSKISIKDRG